MRPRTARSIGCLALAAALGWTQAARAADLRIGYIDSARIFQEYGVAKEAQAQFDRKVEGWRTQSAEKENQVSQLRAEVRDQGPILSTLKRQEKEEALQKAIDAYETFLQDIWGPQGRAVQENEQATGEVVAQIRAVVEKIASQKGLVMVLDSAGGFLIYADRTLDLTSEVLTELATQSKTGAQH
ncbi:MAG TPA: OmpH family outer membrane protein [Candidatus Eisenbacteria bacterium]|jgi:Skp family chaperone for outer membrane proteins